MKLHNLDILESKEVEKLIGMEVINDLLDDCISELNKNRLKIWSSVLVFLIGIACFYIAMTSDSELGWLLKIGLTIPLAILAYVYVKVVRERLRLNKVFKENAKEERVFLEFIDVASMASLYDINKFESSYDNSPAGLVVYLKDGRDTEEVDREKKKVLYVKWISDKDEVNKLYKMFASNRTKKALNIKSTYKDELLDFKVKRD